ncbi:MAG: 3-isopropylmalate dehydratase small subunit [Clostridia bacterium]|jgi:3-isopropylmalate dehydratase small subunit|nr:3-isopropylmalate dehydratase small subunit [Clostridia bacterium]MDH7572053.1 3-isopropylmalate dehydratase small subunit [Clostridia bacterium]
MEFEGRAWVFGDDVDTDLIIPARYLNTTDPAVLAAHCLEAADPDFARKVQAGDILVAGKNFGCGSSREHAPVAIKAAGVACVVAHSFARIFFRNAINIGLPILECPEAARVREGDVLRIEADSGRITNITRGETYQAVPFPAFMQEIIRAGGLMNYVAARLGRDSG